MSALHLPTLAVLLVVVGCAYGADPALAERDARARADGALDGGAQPTDSGRTDAAEEIFVPLDAGRFDAGPRPDGGRIADAGQDAGARSDAAVELDGGTDAGPPRRPNVIFGTSVTFSADFGGLAGADAAC